MTESRLPPALAAERDALVFYHAAECSRAEDCVCCADEAKKVTDALFSRLAEAERQREEARGRAGLWRAAVLYDEAIPEQPLFPWEAPTDG